MYTTSVVAKHGDVVRYSVVHIRVEVLPRVVLTPRMGTGEYGESPLP